jgi:exosortase
MASATPTTAPARSHPAAPWLPLAACLILLVPLFARFFKNLWMREPYQFFPLAIAGGILLAIRARSEDDPGPSAQPISTFLKAALWLPPLILAAASIALRSPWVGMIAFFTAALAHTWSTGGFPRLRAYAPALTMLAIIIPPPFGMEQELTRWLRAQAVEWSSRILNAADTIHIRNGNILDLPVREIMVEEACAGINSTLSVAAAAFFYHLWMRRPVWWLAITLPLSLVFVFAGNTARIAGGSLLLQHTGIDLFKIPFPHEFVGLCVIALCLFLIVSLDNLLQLVSRPPDHTPQPATHSSAQPPAMHRAWLPALATAAILGIGNLPFMHSAASRGLAASENLENLPQPDAFSLPSSLDEWQVVPEEPNAQTSVETSGVRSRVWRFRRGNEMAVVALDYPFHGYHDVSICYAGSGWERVSRTPIPLVSFPGDAVRSELQRRADEHSLLIVSTVDAEGNFVENNALTGTFSERFRDSMDMNTTFRVQCFWTGTEGATRENSEALHRLFLNAHSQLIGQLRQHGLIPPA